MRSRGESNVGQRPEFVFQVSMPDGLPAPPDLAARLLAHVAVDLGPGHDVPVEVVLDARTQDVTGAHQIRIHLAPVVDLGADQWFNLRLTSDGDMRLGGSDDTLAETKQMLAPPNGNDRPSVVIPMFTGSLPHAIRVNARTAPPKPLLISLTFSEPVVVGDLVEGLSFSSSSGSIVGCVWDPLERACAQASSTRTTSAVDVELDHPPTTLPDLQVHLAAGVRGASRTVGEGASLGQSAPQQVYTWSIQSTDWYDTSGRGESITARRASP